MHSVMIMPLIIDDLCRIYLLIKSFYLIYCFIYLSGSLKPIVYLSLYLDAFFVVDPFFFLSHCNLQKCHV